MYFYYKIRSDYQSGCHNRNLTGYKTLVFDNYIIMELTKEQVYQV
jgi:hypothetical protein